MPTKPTQTGYYNPSDFGGDAEVELRRKFLLQSQDARQHFLNVIRPRLDRAYKLYIAYGGDRAREIQSWQSNIFVPYIQAVVETLMPRILDARPDFNVAGRTADDEMKAEKQQQLMDYFWEIAKMDKVSEDLVRACLMYGTGFLQVSWKKDVRKLKFLKTKDITKKLVWKEEERTFYDAPFCEWVDNYSIWYDWHNIDRESKQYWFKRLVLNADEIKRRYPMADPRRLEVALASPGGDLNDYASIRNIVKTTHYSTTKNAERNQEISYVGTYFNTQRFQQIDSRMRMYEVFEWWQPFEDQYAVMVGGSYVPILPDGSMPIPYDFKEAPFLEVPYLKIPGEFEGYGIPLILENPQLLLNTIKNQRVDATTLSIHKMWIVNPLANINRDELVARPFGIVYSIDPQGVREVQFSDIKASAYKEEDMLKADMQHASGVDDFSMGVGDGASSATEVRHLRESTLERVRLFVNHLGDAYADVMRYWMDMSRQLFTQDMQIRIVGGDGQVQFPLIEKDDLMGRFEYRASVLPSIAGQMDVQKKQDMDLFQLLINLPFVDPRKLTSKVLSDWDWNLDSIAQQQDPNQGQDPNAQPGMDPSQMPPTGMPPGMPPGAMPIMAIPPGGAPGAMPAGMPPGMQPGLPQTSQIPPAVLQSALGMLRKPGEMPPGAPGASDFNQAAMPLNIMGGKEPPTVKGILPANGHQGATSNPRGHNRGGKVNTNISKGGNTDAGAQLATRANNIQR